MPPFAHRFNIGRTFLRGLIVLLPILLTLYLALAVVITAELTFGRLLKLITPEDMYYPGLGVFTAIVLVFIFGLLLYTWVVRKIIRVLERHLERVPIVKSVYVAMSDLIGYFRRARNGSQSQVVLVRMMPNCQLLGLVTREDISDLTNDRSGKLIAVYLPMSYQIGGYTVFIPRAIVRPIDIPFEDAMRIILTGGVGGDHKLIDHELREIERELAGESGETPAVMPTGAGSGRRSTLMPDGPTFRD